MKSFEKGLGQVAKDCKSYAAQQAKDESRKAKAEEKKRERPSLMLS